MFSNFVLIFLIQGIFPSSFVLTQESVEQDKKVIPAQSDIKEQYSHSALYLDINDASSVSIYKKTDGDKAEFQTIVVKK